MHSHLTPEQATDIDRRGNQPLEVVHPRTHKVYYVIAGELFDRVRPLFDEDAFDIRETYPAQSAAAAASGWDDPAMEAYNDYEVHRPAA